KGLARCNGLPLFGDWRPTDLACRCRAQLFGSSGARGWCAIVRGKRLSLRDHGGASAVDGGELRAVILGGAGVLDLSLYRRGPGFTKRGCFGRNGTGVDAAGSAVVADAGVTRSRNAALVHVVNDVDVDVCDGAVIGEAAAIPVAAIVASAGVAKTVVDATVEADVSTPVTSMPAVAVAVEVPVGRRPECIDVGCKHPCAGDPVIAAVAVAPVAWRPHIVIAGAGGLAVLGKWRRRLAGINQLAAVIGLVGICVVVARLITALGRGLLIVTVVRVA